MPDAWRDGSELAGRVLMVGVPGGRLDARTTRLLAELQPGGVILFSRNLESPAQTVHLLDDLRERLPRPALFAVDQEGGRVSRLARWIGATPPAAALAAAGEATAEGFGRVTASALRALGFNLDFAPVVDVSGGDATHGIGDRSWGSDPLAVTRLAGSFLDGLEEGGVAGCLKHFPGLGATEVDSHVALPTVLRSRRELEEVELLPFRRLAARAPAVMVAHAHYPALDPTPGVPASLSAAVVSGLLRSALGFGGLVVTDDLEMGAVAPLDVLGDAAPRAIDAGCDLLLYCADLERARRARERLASRARSDAAFRERLRESATTIARFAARWPAPAGDVLAFDAAKDAFAQFA